MWCVCVCVSSVPDKLCQEVLGLCVLQPLSDLLAQPGEDITTITMGLKALYVLLAAS